MKLAHPDMNVVFSFQGSHVNTLVIEEPTFFHTFLQDISRQLQGEPGRAVLSKGDVPIPFSGYAELIDSVLSFQLCRKSLINKIQARMEAAAVDEVHYSRTAALLAELEKYFLELSFDLPVEIHCGKMSMNSILRAVGIEIPEDYGNDLERFLDFMELTRELERDKLFLFVNMRSFYSDSQIALFLDSVLAHEYHVLLIDSVSRPKLPGEKRTTIDCDLCEF